MSQRRPEPGNNAPATAIGTPLMHCLPTLAVLAFTALGPGSPSLERTPVQVSVLDADNLLIRSTQPLESLQFEGLFENTDYIVDWDGSQKAARVRLLTGAASLRLVVETKAGGTLRRRYSVRVAHPSVELLRN